MDANSEVREFLMTRRARIKPSDVGLGSYHPRRRVTGLRREEVATLAGVSVDYYVRVERGNLTGVSESILEAVARALRMTPDERRHLFDLARRANTSNRSHWTRPVRQIRPHVQQILDGMAFPAWVRSTTTDVLATNRLGTALYAPLFESAVGTPNKSRFIFLEPEAQQFYPDWPSVAHDNVAVLRAAAGNNPFDKELSDLIGELSTRNDDFRRIWADHDVLNQQSGVTVISHPMVGHLELFYEVLDLPTDHGLSIVTYGAEAGTPTAENVQILAAWSAEQPSRDRQNIDG